MNLHSVYIKTVLLKL